MALSIPGGATLTADSKTWQDATGKPLSTEQTRQIERLHAERTATRHAAEAQRLASEAQSNPIANALMAILGRGQPAATPQPSPQTLADVVGQEYADKLADAGITTLAGVAASTDEEITSVEGIGAATLKKLRAAQG